MLRGATASRPKLLHQAYHASQITISAHEAAAMNSFDACGPVQQLYGNACVLQDPHILLNLKTCIAIISEHAERTAFWQDSALHEVFQENTLPAQDL